MTQKSSKAVACRSTAWGCPRASCTPTAPSSGFSYGYRANQFATPDVNWLVTKSKDGKVVYMVRRTSHGAGKLDDWGVGSTVEEAIKGDNIWKGNVSPTDGGIRVEDPLESRKVQPNLQTEVKDKLFQITRVEDANGTIKTLTHDRGQQTKLEYKDGALDKIYFPNGRVISKTKDGWSIPTGPDTALTAKDIYVGKGGIIVKTTDKDGDWIGYFTYNDDQTENRWMRITPEKRRVPGEDSRLHGQGWLHSRRHAHRAGVGAGRSRACVTHRRPVRRARASW